MIKFKKSIIYKLLVLVLLLSFLTSCANPAVSSPGKTSNAPSSTQTEQATENEETSTPGQSTDADPSATADTTATQSASDTGNGKTSAPTSTPTGGNNGQSGVKPYVKGASKIDKLVKEYDLASDTDWTISLDGKAQRPIKVPAGGWNSDKQSPRIDRGDDVDRYVIYYRKLKTPDYKPGEVVKILFGAVNFGAEIYINDKLVTQHHGPMMPFEADITKYVAPGKTYDLKVKAYHSRYYNGKIPLGFDYVTDAIVSKPGNWLRDKFSYGITKYIKMAVYPEVYIKDVFIKTSVNNKNLTAEITIHNSTNKARTIDVYGDFSSWNGDKWKYPDFPKTSVKLNANEVRTVTVGPVSWNLGAGSYWWPNIPFNENYLAKLHYLNISVREGSASLDKISQRFGFREVTEGPYYYNVNSVRVNLVSDGTPESAMSEYDCYSISPAFLPPTGSGTGCPETWKRYMRLGINTIRAHQSTPTQYMMETADETGFMLVPETAIRGSAFKQEWGPYMAQAPADLAYATRNYASVIMYSLSNEWGSERRLIDAITPVDTTRPLVFEVNHTSVPGKITGYNGGHAYQMLHYCDYPKPAKVITGMGEYAWSTDGIMDFVNIGKDMRVNDIAYFALWDMINFWPNLLEGMSKKKHAWIQNAHADRKDGVDGWNSPVIQHVQKSLSPFLVMDKGFEATNKSSQKWPTFIPRYKFGENIDRNIEIFNGDLSGDTLTVKWEARWDSVTGSVLKQGSFDNIKIQPGFHASKAISLSTPKSSGSDRKVYLILKSYKNGKEVFKDDRIYFNISNSEVFTNAEFVSTDTVTKGSWMGKYGKDGHYIMGATNSIPGYAKIGNWSATSDWTWENNTKDARGLEYFANTTDGTGKSRIMACKFVFGGQEISYDLDLGKDYHYLSLYLLDADNSKRSEKIEIIDVENGTSLSSKDVSNFSGGVYLKYKIRGKVKVKITLLTGTNAVLSGMFFDT